MILMYIIGIFWATMFLELMNCEFKTKLIYLSCSFIVILGVHFNYFKVLYKEAREQNTTFCESCFIFWWIFFGPITLITLIIRVSCLIYDQYFC